MRRLYSGVVVLDVDGVLTPHAGQDTNSLYSRFIAALPQLDTGSPSLRNPLSLLALLQDTGPVVATYVNQHVSEMAARRLRTFFLLARSLAWRVLLVSNNYLRRVPPSSSCLL